MVNDLSASDVFRRLERITSASPGPQKVLESILHEAIELTGAERGFVLSLAEPSAEVTDDLELDTVVAVNLDSATQFEYSRTIVHDALRQSKGLVLLDAGGDSEFGAAESVRRLEIRSVMAVPLRVEHQLVGAIYLDNRTHAAKFTEKELSLLTNFANVAALAVENARLLRACRAQFLELVQAREAEQAAHQARKAAEQARRSVSQYAVEASQELKMPLLALRKAIKSGGEEALSRVEQLSQLILAQVDELHEVSRADGGMPDLHLEEVNLSQLTTKACERLEDRVLELGVEFSVSCDPDLPLVGDENRLGRVLFCLLRNAVKSSPEGEVRVTAGSGKPGTALVTIEVGAGHQPLAGPVRDFCHRTVSLHHGRLWTEADGDKHTFVLELPREQLSLPNSARSAWRPD